LEIQPVSPSAKPRRADEPESPKCPLPPIGPDTRNTGIDYPPADKTLPFLYLHAIEQKEPQDDTAQEPDWYPRIQPFDGAIVSAMAPPQDPESLLSWQQLWPVIHCLFRDDKQTNRLHTPALIRHAVRREPLTAIPWRRRLRWPGELVLLVDFSPHLAPYFTDYGLVAGRLKRWLRERVKVVVCVDAEQQHYVDDSGEYRGLPPWLDDTEMLYLGDLGFLDRQRIGKARW